MNKDFTVEDSLIPIVFKEFKKVYEFRKRIFNLRKEHGFKPNFNYLQNTSREQLYEDKVKQVKKKASKEIS